MSAVEMTGRITAMEDSLFAKPSSTRAARRRCWTSTRRSCANIRWTPFPEYLFGGAGGLGALDGRMKAPVARRIIKEYPPGTGSWTRTTWKAFTLDADLDRKGEAETAYREVIDDTRTILCPRRPGDDDNLPYTDEELMSASAR